MVGKIEFDKEVAIGCPSAYKGTVFAVVDYYQDRSGPITKYVDFSLFYECALKKARRLRRVLNGYHKVLVVPYNVNPERVRLVTID